MEEKSEEDIEMKTGVDLALEKINVDETREAKVLTDFIKSRINKRLACNILCTGELGKGKSYSGIRLLELWYKRQFSEKFPKSHICQNLETAMLLVRDFKRKGEGVLVEELSVLISSRDSLTKQNKVWNKFMDVIRIKQAILVGNLPFLSFVDKHMIALCQVWLDVLGINFRKKISVCKPLIIQQPSFKHDPYHHKFVDDEGDEVDLIIFKKPSKELCKFYDELKISSVGNVIDEMLEDMIADKRRKLKEKGKIVLAFQEEQDYSERLDGLTTKEIAEKRGVCVTAVAQNIRNARKKLNMIRNKGKIPRKRNKSI